MAEDVNDRENHPADLGGDGRAEASTSETLGKALRSSAIGRAGTEGVKGAIGGPWGVVSSILPGLLFVLIYTITTDLKASLISALAVGVVVLIVSLLRRQSPSQAIGGLVGIAVCAIVAAKTGKAEDYFVPGFFINIGAILLYVVTILVRWPIIGLIAGFLTGEELRWRQDPSRVRLFQKVTWLWVAMFAVRLAIQLPLYYSGNVTALGTLRLALGVPLFALVAWVSWMIIRASPAVPAEDPPRPAA